MKTCPKCGGANYELIDGHGEERDYWYCWDCGDVELMPWGFWMMTPEGNTIHVNGNPAMEEETAQALAELMDLLARQHGAKNAPQTPQDARNGG